MAKITTNKENNEPVVVENGKKKKEEKPPTKVVVRRLPPTMTEEQFKLQVSPLPENDYFYYVPADMSLTPNAFCRAYINFVNQSDLFIFTQKFDGYVFVDSKGSEYPAVVEFAPFQRIPKNRPHRRKDPKTGTIESDPLFVVFKERLEAQSQENKAANNASKQHFFETSLIPEKKEANNTPLLDFIKNKRAERQRIRDEKREEKRKKDLERRKAKEEQRRTKKDDEASVVKPSSLQPIHSNSKDPVKSPCSNSDKYFSRNKNLIDNTEKVVNTLQNEPCTQPNIEKNEQKISKKVRDLVSLFNQSITESNIIESNIKNETTFFNCIKHIDIESQIIKNVDKDFKTVNSGEISINPVPKKWQRHKIPLLSDYNELNYKSPRIIIPLVDTRPRVFIQRPIIPCRQPIHNILMKPIPIVSSKNDCQKDNKIDDIKKGSKTVFPGEVFRKNLQKVVADVLGHSKVKSPRENIISKPKTFVQRACVGSGESCSRPGFNSPNFYLPPRAFGCGPSTSTPESIKENSKHSIKIPNSDTYKPLNIYASGKNDLPIVPRKNLPPFSNKNIFSSKSDGDIDKNDDCIKVGGSEESLKTQSWGLDFKQVPVRRPHVTPKKSIILEKTMKVSL